MAPNFFISYSTVDAEKASEVRGLLESVGASCWMAPDSIAPGEPYTLAIPKAIRECTSMMLVFSKYADESEDVMSEVTLARKYKKKIIPIRVDNSEPTQLEYHLGLPQWVDFYGPRRSSGEAKLRTLVSSLTDAAKPDPPATTVAAKPEERQESHQFFPEAIAGTAEYRYDLYVSYAPVDNVPAPGEPGWVTYLVQQLRVALSQQLGAPVQIFFDWNAWGPAPLAEKIGAVQSSAMFLAFTSPGYLNSRLTREELAAFLAGQRDLSRLFVIECDPVEGGRYPQPLCDVKRHRLGKSHVLDFVRGLAIEMAEVLRSLLPASTGL